MTGEFDKLTKLVYNMCLFRKEIGNINKEIAKLSGKREIKEKATKLIEENIQKELKKLKNK